MISNSGVVESARRGDLFAFQTLVERYQSPIYRYLYRLVGDVDVARRLALATFLAAHKKIKRLDKDLRFEAWLYRLATQAATSHLRWQRLTRRLPRRRRPRLSTEDDQEAQVVQAALVRLPPSAAIGLLLAGAGGFSYDEMAQILHVSAGGVRARISEGRRRVRLLIATSDVADAGKTCSTIRPLLSPYVDHQISGDERAAVEEHLATCAGCRSIVADYQELDRRLTRMKARGGSVSIAYDVMDILRGKKTASPQRARGSPGLQFAALVVVLVLLVAAGFGALRLASRAGEGGGSGMLYVGLQSAEGHVAVVNVRSESLVATILVGSRPVKLAAARDGRHIYVLGEDGIVSVIDAALNAVSDRLETGGRPGGIALSPDDKTLYVTMSDRRGVIYIDTSTGRQFGEARVGRSPREVVASPDGQWVLVFNSSDNTVSKIKPGARQEVKVLPLRRTGDANTEFSSHPMAVTSDGRKLYVAELNRERIWSVDLTTDEVRSFDVPLRDLGRDILVAVSGDRLYVTHGDPRGARSALAGLASMDLPKVERTAEIRGYYYGVASSPDGATIFATNPDENVVIFADAQTLQTTATILVGQRPASIVYAPKVK